ncbi:MAG TPA: hypothetical protein VGS19_07735 [Streptosporangiaceae bacterium]|nr:hypothetical protein [Streptosporangiaceae bacterium]
MAADAGLGSIGGSPGRAEVDVAVVLAGYPGPVEKADWLERALRDDPGWRLRSPPPMAEELLVRLDAPPRLATHLRLVHDVAVDITAWTRHRCPDLDLDHDALLFGAATHDIGKVSHIGELTGPGSEHEETERRLLLVEGVSPIWPVSRRPTPPGPAPTSRPRTCP